MWIFWHDWWPWYLGGMTVFTIATGVLLAVLKRRDRPKPCIPITCPPAEEVEISFTLIACPLCGRVPRCEPSMWVWSDRYDWICPVHGVIAHYVRGDSGQLNGGVIE